MQRGLAPIIFLIVAVVLLAALGGIYYYSAAKKVAQIQSFDDCVKAGYPVLTTYPEQCKTPDGRNFVKPTPVQSLAPIPQPTGVISQPGVGDQAPQPQ